MITTHRSRPLALLVVILVMHAAATMADDPWTRAVAFYRAQLAQHGIVGSSLLLMKDGEIAGQAVHGLMLQTYTRYGHSSRSYPVDERFWRDLASHVEITPFTARSRDGRLVALLLVSRSGHTARLVAFGMDYAVRGRSHLYFLLNHDAIAWAIANGITTMRGGIGAQVEKRRMGYRGERAYFCCAATRPWLDSVLQRAFPLAESVLSRRPS